MEKIHITKHVIQRFLERYKYNYANSVTWFIRHMVINAENRWTVGDIDYRSYGEFIFVCVKKIINSEPVLYIITMITKKSDQIQTSSDIERASKNICNHYFLKGKSKSNDKNNKVSESQIDKGINKACSKSLKNNPVIQLENYNFLVASKRHKDRFYNVNLGKPYCDCSGFAKGLAFNQTNLCTHIKLASLFLESLGQKAAFSWEANVKEYPIYINSFNHERFDSTFMEVHCPICLRSLVAPHGYVSDGKVFKGDLSCPYCYSEYFAKIEVWICIEDRIHCKKTLYWPDGRSVVNVN